MIKFFSSLLQKSQAEIQDPLNYHEPVIDSFGKENFLRPKPWVQTLKDKTFDLDTPLLHLSPVDTWTIRDACEGTQIFGATGSGKTSGSGQTIAKSFLYHGFGGLVLTAKPDETELWKDYCHQMGRGDDIVVISPDSPFRFNFLDYELRRSQKLGHGNSTENLVHLFMNVLEVVERSTTKGQQDSYWQRTLKQLVRNAIDLITLTSGSLTLIDMYQVIISAPQSLSDLTSIDWRNHSLCAKLILKAQELYNSDEEDEPAEYHSSSLESLTSPRLTPSQKRDLEQTIDYFLKEFPTLADKTRSVIVSSFTSLADSFLRGSLRELFCTDTNITPEVSFDGKIIILDLPKKTHHELGQYAQVLFKYLWQRSVEQRSITPTTKPVFLWADESQFFINSYDSEFQTTARSSRSCTVYLTQNLPNYYSAIGDKHQVESFLGNLQTKIFHANGDTVTNTYASELISKEWNFRSNQSQTNPSSGQGQSSQGSSQSLEYQVPPKSFGSLKKGGKDNTYHTEAYIYQAGRTWKENGKNYVKAVFGQKVEVVR